MFATKLEPTESVCHIVDVLPACHNAPMQAPALFSDPIAVDGPHECTFYHSLDLPSFGSMRGHWDLRGRFDDYTGALSWSGKSVLDIGTASGFLSFEAEKRGARVVSFDVDDARHLDVLAFPNNPRQRSREQWLLWRNTRILALRKSYWLAHRDYHSRNQVCYADLYNIPLELGSFDIVVLGQILVHLRDAVRAIERAAAHCAKTLVVAEGMIDSDEPYSRFLGHPDRPENDFALWHHSTGFYVRYLAILGFKLRQRSINTYVCNRDPNEPGRITTLVFDRQ
jgi:SAM-dependent methyltransferase